MESRAGSDSPLEKVSLKPRRNDSNPKSMREATNPPLEFKNRSIQERSSETKTGMEIESCPRSTKSLSGSDEDPALNQDRELKPLQGSTLAITEGIRSMFDRFTEKVDELSLDIRDLRDQLQDQQSQLDAHDSQLQALSDQIEDHQSRLEAHDIQLQEQDIELSDHEQDIEDLGAMVLSLE